MTPTRLRCGFGSPWGARGCGPCAKCRAQLAKDCADFERDVFFGVYDDRGYTPRESAAHERTRRAVAS